MFTEEAYRDPRMMRSSIHRCTLVLATLAALLLTAGPPLAAGGVTFTDIATNDGAGITYRRAQSPRNALFEALKALPLYTMADLPQTPIKPRGAPGVALFDFDRDGDLDIYVTNGPGTPNSLYSNQLRETGSVAFLDVAVAAGIDATDQDSSGVCVGDLDNDGDDDVLVLATNQPNRLFENLGNGTFLDITGLSDIGGGDRGSTTCSLGDVDGDGLLDIVVGNTWGDWEHQLPIFVEPFDLNEHNQLFLNAGGNIFLDASASSGIEDTRGFRPAADGSATVTWSLALVDVDLDGDVDLVQADDQAAIPFFDRGGVDRGFLHLFLNDGSGHLTDVSAAAGTVRQGQWMGLSFGDLNCDGHLDIFGSNLGDYMFTLLDPTYQLGASASRWFLGQPDGTFLDPGVGPDLVATPFGWGCGVADYDNDGDPDIIFHGGLDVGPFVEASNPGTVLENQGCTAHFVRDATATSATDHQRRNVQGVALGDLDDDGFVDVVSVSNFNQPSPIPLVSYGVTYGSPFDVAAFVPTFLPTGPGEFVFSGIQLPDGTLSVELNSGGNGNGWVKVTTLGTRGLTSGGTVNRDGVGAVLSFTPHRGATSLQPVVAGSSYASTHSREIVFGLGAARSGVVEVRWPGGVRNRLYGVTRGERLLLPEIPCSFDGEWPNGRAYTSCVVSSLAELNAAGILNRRQSSRLLASALRAFGEAHRRRP